MTVKLVEAPPSVYRAACRKCGATFSYHISDLHRNYLTGGECVWCPSCGEPHRHADQRRALP